MYLANLLPRKTLDKLQIAVPTCDWHPTLAVSERCGVLFQQTTLLDELTVAGNLAVALEAHNSSHSPHNKGGEPLSEDGSTITARDRRIKQLLDTVGLSYDRDAGKRVSELSGGMARRASLALQLAQRKHVIVLDEPFAGLDHEAATAVAAELVHLRKLQTGTALVLIAHEHELAEKVLATEQFGGDGEGSNVVVEFEEPPVVAENDEASQHHRLRHKKKPNLFGTHFRDRFIERLADYIGYSLPLILLTFIACGMAIAMLSSDTLRRIDVSGQGE